MDLEHLATFTFAVDGAFDTFRFDVRNFSASGIDALPEVAADEISISMMIGNANGGGPCWEPFELRSETWIGHKLLPADALAQVVDAFVYDDPDYDFEFASDEMEALRDELRQARDRNRRLDVDVLGTPIAMRRHDFYRARVFDLVLVTDANYFYDCADGESMLMFSSNDRRLVSDNYFASDGLVDSMLAVFDGREVLLWEDGEKLRHLKEEIAAGEYR